MRPRWLVPAFAAFFPVILATYACSIDGGVVDALPLSGSDGGSADAAVSTDAPTTDANGHDGSPLDGAAPDGATGPTLVYANTQSDLYSLDVNSNKLTHLAALSSQCGDNTNDIAIDSSGQLYIFESNDAIYRLALDGTCSGRDVLSAMASDNLKISGRNAGSPVVVSIDTSHTDYYSIDPASTPQANVTKITSGLFSFAPKYDVACSQNGTCWTALDNSHCSAGSSSSCLYSFNADGSGTPVLLGALNVQPQGLAYAGGALYSFADDGSIAKITLGGAPIASIIAVNGATQPDSWNGAGSTSAYP
jgi:hypothetical protein